MCSLHQNDRFHIVCVGSLIDLERVQRSLKVLQPCKSWSRLQALNKGVIEVQLLEVEVKVLRWEAAHGAGTKTDFKSNAEKKLFWKHLLFVAYLSSRHFLAPSCILTQYQKHITKVKASIQAFCNEMLGNRVGFCQPQNLYYNCRHFLLVFFVLGISGLHAYCAGRSVTQIIIGKLVALIIIYIATSREQRCAR